jgi:hypothetical protein
MSQSGAAKVFIGKASVTEAQALKARLAGAGFEIALVHNEATCGRGCATQVEVWAHPDDLEAIAGFLGEEWAKTCESMGYDHALATAVFDPDAATATCPACATTFPTSSTRCPECDLNFDFAPVDEPKRC